jgi:hypothetical protein
MFVCVYLCNVNMHISTKLHLEWLFGYDTPSQVDPCVEH